MVFKNWALQQESEKKIYFNWKNLLKREVNLFIHFMLEWLHYHLKSVLQTKLYRPWRRGCHGGGHTLAGDAVPVSRGGCCCSCIASCADQGRDLGLRTPTAPRRCGGHPRQDLSHDQLDKVESTISIQSFTTWEAEKCVLGSNLGCCTGLFGYISVQYF